MKGRDRGEESGRSVGFQPLPGAPPLCAGGPPPLFHFRRWRPFLSFQTRPGSHSSWVRLPFSYSVFPYFT